MREDSSDDEKGKHRWHLNSLEQRDQERHEDKKRDKRMQAEAVYSLESIARHERRRYFFIYQH